MSPIFGNPHLGSLQGSFKDPFPRQSSFRELLKQPALSRHGKCHTLMARPLNPEGFGGLGQRAETFRFLEWGRGSDRGLRDTVPIRWPGRFGFYGNLRVLTLNPETLHNKQYTKHQIADKWKTKNPCEHKHIHMYIYIHTYTHIQVCSHVCMSVSWEFANGPRRPR